MLPLLAAIGDAVGSAASTAATAVGQATSGGALTGAAAKAAGASELMSMAKGGAAQSSQNSGVLGISPLSSSPAANTSYGYHFYGGESVSQIKNSASNKVVLHGCTDGLKNNEEKGFYKNVTIPRKQV